MTGVSATGRLGSSKGIDTSRNEKNKRPPRTSRGGPDLLILRDFDLRVRRGGGRLVARRRARRCVGLAVGVLVLAGGRLVVASRRLVVAGRRLVVAARRLAGRYRVVARH